MNARPSWPLFYTDPDADAHGILCYTITHGEPPAGLDSERLARAEARAIVANARRPDEDARSVDTIANAKRAIAAAYRRALASERAEAEARAAALAEENPTPDAPDAGQDTSPDQDRIVAGLAEVLTAALAIALTRTAQPDAPAPGQRRPQAKTNGNGKTDDDGNPGSHDRIPTPPKTNPRGPQPAAFVNF